MKPPTHLLIVDDVLDVRRELRVLLSLSAELCISGEAADGLEAIRQAEALHPDAILMDLEMPRLGGLEAARRIKRLLPGCRIIALTIHDTQENRARCLQAGMDAFLAKGAGMEALLRAIRPDPSGEPEEGEMK